MAEATQRVRVTENARDERTGLVVYAGEEKTLLGTVAGRFLAAGVAVAVEDEAPKEETATEADWQAAAKELGVDLATVDQAGEKSAKSEIINAIKKGT